MIYIVTFILSVFLCKIAEKVYCGSIRSDQRGYLIYACLIFAILLPALLAGLRSVNIGTDTRLYVKPIFEQAVNASSFKEYYDSKWLYATGYFYDSVRNYDFGYISLIYLISLISQNLNIALLIVELFILIPVMWACWNLKDRYSIAICMMSYYFLFYNSGLNISRQSIAIAFGLLAFSFLMTGKAGWTMLFTVISILFHRSAILSVIVFAIYLYMEKQKTRHKRLRIQLGRRHIDSDCIQLVLLLAISLVGLLAVPLVARIMTMIPSMKRFAHVYLGGLGSFSYMTNQILLRLPILILILMNYREISTRDRSAKFYAVMFVFEIAFSQLVSFHAAAIRISWYFGIYKLFLFSDLWFVDSRKKRILNKLMILVWIVVYFTFYYVMQRSGETIPYRSIFG